MLSHCVERRFRGESVPTFTKDVAPILYNRCLECHRPGEAGPMAFRTYQETRPWAKAIKQAVMTHNMPPWYADTKIDHFKNDRHLSDQEIATDHVSGWTRARRKARRPNCRSCRNSRKAG